MHRSGAGTCDRAYPRLVSLPRSAALRLRVTAPVVASLAGAAPAAGMRSMATTVSSAHADSILVFRRVTVVDVRDGRLRPAQTVVVAGNRIRAVGPTGKVHVPFCARVVDGRGKYLIPGLWDMHSHLYTLDSTLGRASLPLLVAHGVTGIREVAGYVPLDTVRQWQREVAAGTRVGPPRQLVTGPMLESQDTAMFGLDGRRVLTLPTWTPEQVRRSVALLKASGADFVKEHANLLPRETFFALAAAARAAHLPLVGHVVESVSIAEASDSGLHSIEHILQIMRQLPECMGRAASIARCTPLARRLARNGTWLTPTLSVHGVRRWTNVPAALRPSFPASVNPERPLQASDTVSDTAVISWPDPASSDHQLFDLTILRRSGVPILAGTDVTTPLVGAALHVELSLLVAAGMTPLGALQAATLNPAKYLHGTDSLGTVEPGKLADLVLLDANPLADIRNTAAIRAVVANGRYFDRAALDRLLAEAPGAAGR